MTTEHSDIGNSLLHESKGVSAADDGQLLTAASGINSFAFPILTLHLDIIDIVTDTSYFIPVPYAGDIKKLDTCIDSAFSTADCAVALEIATVAVTSGSLTITQSGSAAGDVDSVTPSALNSVDAGGSIEVIISGTNTGATRCHVTITYQRTA